GIELLGLRENLDLVCRGADQPQLLLLGLLLRNLEGLRLVAARKLERDAIIALADLDSFALGLDQGPAGEPWLHDNKLARLLGRAAHAIDRGLAYQPGKAQCAIDDRAAGDPIGLRRVALDRDLLVERIGQQARLAEREARQPGIADIGHI